MGLLSALGSGITTFGNSIGSQIDAFGQSLIPSPANQGAVVDSMPLFPDIYSDPHSQFNPNYALHLYGKDEQNNTVDIMASLPEHFSWHLAADWQPLLHNPSIAAMAGQFAKDAVSIAAIAKGGFGFTDYGTAQTQQVWNSTTPLDISFPFVFNAVYNPTDEVMKPVRDLMLLLSPSTTADGFFLKVPGPTVQTIFNKSGYQMCLRIGNAIVFDNVIVTGVAPAFDVMAHSSGDFISAQVDVSIRTSRILTKTDVMAMFINLISEATKASNTSSNPGKVFSSSQLSAHQG